MEGLWTINGDPYEKIVFSKEFTPDLIEQDTIGLKSILDLLPIGIALLERDHFLKIINTQKGWFATLPGKMHRSSSLGFYLLPDVGFQEIRAQFEINVFRIEMLLFEIKTIGAIEIAEWTNGFCQDLEDL